jgi:SAM-dependent methyltransferase
MKITYLWDKNYDNPAYWDKRQIKHCGMPPLYDIYQKLNDNKLKRFLRSLNGLILDAGCGEGRLMAYADVGMDFSKVKISKAKNNNPSKHFVRASILNIPFRQSAFNNAFSVDVLLHVPFDKHDQVLSELTRISKTKYVFLAEHRSVTPFIFELFRNTRTKMPQAIWPYLAMLLAFPIDRLRGLVKGERSNENKRNYHISKATDTDRIAKLPCAV